VPRQIDAAADEAHAFPSEPAALLEARGTRAERHAAAGAHDAMPGDDAGLLAAKGAQRPADRASTTAGAEQRRELPVGDHATAWDLTDEGVDPVEEALRLRRHRPGGFVSFGGCWPGAVGGATCSGEAWGVVRISSSPAPVGRGAGGG
jgi:hypothetical protein